MTMLQSPHINVNEGMRNMSEQREWISTHEAAKLLDMELSSISRLCRTGKINCRQYGTGQRSVWEVDKASAIAYRDKEKPVGGRPRKVG